MSSEPSASSSSLLLFAMLPALVQRRIPKFRSLKRTLSEQETPGCHSRMSSYSTLVDNMPTPPPSYRAMPSNIDSDDEGSINFRYQHNAAPSRPSSAGSIASPYPEEFRSGIRWKYAEPGFSMLSLSSQEASTSQPGVNLVRQQYISGVSCILRGLPANLTADEELGLREALPVILLRSSRDEQAMVHSPDTRADQGQKPDSASQRPILQRSVAMLTCYIFIAIAFILPYIQILFRHAYHLDRKHKISDRVLARGVAAADAMGRHTLVLATNICAMHDGKVGDLMKEAGVYVVQSFSGGVYDGLGEGMQALGLRGGFDLNGSKSVRSRQLQQR